MAALLVFAVGSFLHRDTSSAWLPNGSSDPGFCDNRKNIHIYLCPHGTVSPLAENLFSPQSQKDLLVSFGLSSRTVFLPSLLWGRHIAVTAL